MDIALVHGSYHGAWCWDHLRGPLEAAGHRVITPDLPISTPGLGAQAYADVVIDAIADSDEPLVVGHSMSGIVIPLVAARRPVRRLVFLAAFLPSPGLSINDQRAAEPIDGLRAPERRRVPGPRRRRLDGRSDDRDRALLQRRAARGRPLGDAASPSAVLHGDDRGHAAAALARRAEHDHRLRAGRAMNPDWLRTASRERLGIEALELPGGHSPFLGRPEELAAMLGDAGLSRRSTSVSRWLDDHLDAGPRLERRERFRASSSSEPVAHEAREVDPACRRQRDRPIEVLSPHPATQLDGQLLAPRDARPVGGPVAGRDPDEHHPTARPGEVDGRGEAVIGAGRVEDDVDVAGRARNGLGRANLERRGQAMGERLTATRSADVDVAQHLDDQQPDRPAAEDGGGLAGPNAARSTAWSATPRGSRSAPASAESDGGTGRSRRSGHHSADRSAPSVTLCPAKRALGRDVAARPAGRARPAGDPGRRPRAGRRRAAH